MEEKINIYLQKIADDYSEEKPKKHRLATFAGTAAGAGIGARYGAHVGEIAGTIGGPKGSTIGLVAGLGAGLIGGAKLGNKITHNAYEKKAALKKLAETYSVNRGNDESIHLNRDENKKYEKAKGEHVGGKLGTLGVMGGLGAGAGYLLSSHASRKAGPAVQHAAKYLSTIYGAHKGLDSAARMNRDDALSSVSKTIKDEVNHELPAAHKKHASIIEKLGGVAGLGASILGAAKNTGRAIMNDAKALPGQVRNVGTAFKANGGGRGGITNAGTVASAKAVLKNKAVLTGAGVVGAGVAANSMRNKSD